MKKLILFVQTLAILTALNADHHDLRRSYPSQPAFVDQRLERVLLITGCARSGTTFMSLFLQKNGLEVKHEVDGAFGIVSWMLTPDSNLTPVGYGSNKYSFRHIFHQVRDPLNTINSLACLTPFAWSYICKFVPQISMKDSLLVKGAKYWYYWNLLAEQKAEWTYQIENLAFASEEMSERLGVVIDPSLIESVATDTNSYNWRTDYNWNDLYDALDETLFWKIVALSERYGYPVSEPYNSTFNTFGNCFQTHISATPDKR